VNQEILSKFSLREGFNVQLLFGEVLMWCLIRLEAAVCGAAEP